MTSIIPSECPSYSIDRYDAMCSEACKIGYLTGVYSDLILSVGSDESNVKFKVHKLVVCNAIRQIEKIILEDVRSDVKDIILHLRDTSPHIMKYILDFVYLGKATVEEKDLAELMEEARYLEVKGLSKDIHDSVDGQQLKVENDEEKLIAAESMINLNVAHNLTTVDSGMLPLPRSPVTASQYPAPPLTQEYAPMEDTHEVEAPAIAGHSVAFHPSSRKYQAADARSNSATPPATDGYSLDEESDSSDSECDLRIVEEDPEDESMPMDYYEDYSAADNEPQDLRVESRFKADQIEMKPEVIPITSVTPRQITSVIPHQITSVTPRQITSVIPRQITSVIPQQITSVIPHQITSVIPRQITSVIPRQINSVTPCQSLISNLPGLISLRESGPNNEFGLKTSTISSKTFPSTKLLHTDLYGMQASTSKIINNSITENNLNRIVVPMSEAVVIEGVPVNNIMKIPDIKQSQTKHNLSLAVDLSAAERLGNEFVQHRHVIKMENDQTDGSIGPIRVSSNRSRNTKEKTYTPEVLAESVMMVIRGERTPIWIIRHKDIPRRTLFRHLHDMKVKLGIKVDKPRRKKKPTENSNNSQNSTLSNSSSANSQGHSSRSTPNENLRIGQLDEKNLRQLPNEVGGVVTQNRPLMEFLNKLNYTANQIAPASNGIDNETSVTEVLSRRKKCSVKMETSVKRLPSTSKKGKSIKFTSTSTASPPTGPLIEVTIKDYISSITPPIYRANPIDRPKSASPHNSMKYVTLYPSRPNSVK